MTHTFGPFSYDSDERVLSREGARVALVPKAVDVLHVLLERRGQIVEKSELMRLVWPDTTVEETGLTRNISLLRKALGEDAEEYVQTVPKRGYRFVPAEAPAESPQPRSRRWALAAGLVLVMVGFAVYWQFFRPGPALHTAGDVVNVAVLPFEVLDGADGTLQRGLNEALVASLSKMSGVRVLSPSTVARYQATSVPPHIMARLLGVDATVEGVVQRSGAGVRGTARLNDVHTGKVIWSGPFEGAAGALELEAARSISAAMEPHLAVRRRR